MGKKSEKFGYRFDTQVYDHLRHKTTCGRVTRGKIAGDSHLRDKTTRGRVTRGKKRVTLAGIWQMTKRWGTV